MSTNPVKTGKFARFLNELDEAKFFKLAELVSRESSERTKRALVDYLDNLIAEVL